MNEFMNECMHGAVARSVAQQRQHVRTCTTLHTQGTFTSKHLSPVCRAIPAHLCVPTVLVGFLCVVVGSVRAALCFAAFWLFLTCSLLAAASASTTMRSRGRCSSPRTPRMSWRRLPMR